MGLRRGADLAERLLTIGVEVVRVARALPRDVGSRHIALQLLRSRTSAGANYEEARAAESKGDFIHKVRIAAKEMREALFWLELVRRSQRELAGIDRLILEANELTAILTASAETARRNR